MKWWNYDNHIHVQIDIPQATQNITDVLMTSFVWFDVFVIHIHTRYHIWHSLSAFSPSLSLFPLCLSPPSSLFVSHTPHSARQDEYTHLLSIYRVHFLTLFQLLLHMIVRDKYLTSYRPSLESQQHWRCCFFPIQ